VFGESLCISIEIVGLHASNQCRHGNVPTPPSDFYTHTLEVDFLCFSSGGGEHPSARESTLLVRDVSMTECVTMAMEIRAGLLAVFLKGEDSKGERYHELLVFDWKTAQNIAVSVIGITGDLMS
jgi:hypothetical protein